MVYQVLPLEIEKENVRESCCRRARFKTNTYMTLLNIHFILISYFLKYLRFCSPLNIQYRGVNDVDVHV